MKVRQALGKFREVFLAETNEKKRCLSQFGIEEEFVQLSRQPLKILCGGQSSIGEAKKLKKTKKCRLSQLGTEEHKNATYLNWVHKKNLCNCHYSQ